MPASSGLPPANLTPVHVRTERYAAQSMHPFFGRLPCCSQMETVYSLADGLPKLDAGAKSAKMISARPSYERVVSFGTVLNHAEPFRTILIHSVPF